jgi:N-acetylmuramoyl-L-alanine amidase
MRRLLFLFPVLLSSLPVHPENVDTTFPEAVAEVPASTAPAAEPVTAPPPSAPSLLRVVHPPEGAALGAVKRSFVYGWAEPGGLLTLNGVPVTVHPGGGWLAMTDYVPGANVLHFVYEKNGASVSLDRTLTVGGASGAPGPMEGLRPDQSVSVRPGERVEVSFRGASGGKAHFEVQGMKGKFPMAEAEGTYRGYFFAPSDLSKAAVKITFDPPSKGHDISREAPGRVTALPSENPWVVEVSTDLAILTAGPGFSAKDRAGYLMYPPPGVRMEVTGALGEELRVQISDGRPAWIGRDQVKDLPPGTPLPRAVTGAVSVVPVPGGALARMAISRRVPFQVSVEDDGRRVDVRFYGASSNTDWVHLSAVLPWVREVRWFQESADVYRLSVYTTEDSWWGHDARYENGSFVLELRRPPAMVNARFPLEGLTVAVDPGHLPDNGAIGITGSLEKDINLAIARRLASMLQADRARVVMVREGENPVALYDRPKIAWAARADVLVSVHNNALPEGDNPFEKNGYGVYYFNPRSLPFAREIYRAYAERFDTGRNAMRAVMRNDGLHWGNLALPRTPQMPAVLTESAYMIYPPEEWWLRQPAFQNDCAAAMLEGLRNYAKKMRPTR